MDRDLWKREMLDSINILLDKRGDPREEPLWDSLQLAVDSLGAETVDMSGVKACLNQYAALLVDLFAKPPRRVRKRWVINPNSFLRLEDKEIKSLSIVETYK